MSNRHYIFRFAILDSNWTPGCLQKSELTPNFINHEGHEVTQRVESQKPPSRAFVPFVVKWEYYRNPLTVLNPPYNDLQ
jgi:hypothetical protein